MMEEEFWIGFVAGMIILALFLDVGIQITAPIHLSKQTGDDICHNLTGDENSKAEGLNTKLICTTPSFDSTTNIIIKKAGQ